jgi:hypothetical protein
MRPPSRLRRDHICRTVEGGQWPATGVGANHGAHCGILELRHRLTPRDPVFLRRREGPQPSNESILRVHSHMMLRPTCDSDVCCSQARHQTAQPYPGTRARRRPSRHSGCIRAEVFHDGVPAAATMTHSPGPPVSPACRSRGSPRPRGQATAAHLDGAAVGRLHTPRLPTGGVAVHVNESAARPAGGDGTHPHRSEPRDRYAERREKDRQWSIGIDGPSVGRFPGRMGGRGDQ